MRYAYERKDKTKKFGAFDEHYNSSGRDVLCHTKQDSCDARHMIYQLLVRRECAYVCLFIFSIAL